MSIEVCRWRTGARWGTTRSCECCFGLSARRTLSSLDGVSDSRSPRARRKSAQPPLSTPHPIGTPTNGVSPNTGPLASAAWLVARGLTPREARWYAEIEIATSERELEGDLPTLLRVEVFSEEWGVWFRRGDKVSWIRVTDVPFVHGRDDHGLLAITPPLKKIGTLVHELERRFGFRFVIETAVIRTSMFGAEPAIREWIGSW